MRWIFYFLLIFNIILNMHTVFFPEDFYNKERLTKLVNL